MEDPGPEASPSSRLPWIGVLLVIGVLLATAIAIVRNVGQGPRPPFLDAPVVEGSPPSRTDDRLHVAGSGSCVPLVRMLAAAAIQAGIPAPDVHASIGSGGGIRALQDGATDIALVSRPLRPDEEARGLVYIPFARVPVIVATHLDVPDRDLSFAQLEALYRGEQLTWTDGSQVVVLQRERGDSSHRVVEDVRPGFSYANEQARAAELFRVLYHDSAMQVALANTPGAVGLHGNGVDPWSAGFRAASLEGIEPTVENVERGIYPFVKELAFVTMGQPEGEVAGFVDFVRSAAGRATLRVRGAVPVLGDEEGQVTP